MYSAYKLNKQGNNIQPWCTPFPIFNQSVVPCPVLTVASWPAYRFLRRQVRWSGIPISLRILHSLLWSTQSNACIPQIHMLKSNPQGNGTWRWDLWEVIGSWVWSPHEWDYHPYKKGSRKLPSAKCNCKQQFCMNKDLPRHWICQHLDLGLPISPPSL